jgi:hypothetical protein
VLALVWEGAAGTPVTLLAECMGAAPISCSSRTASCRVRPAHRPAVNRARVTLRPTLPAAPPQRKLDAGAATVEQLAALLDAAAGTTGALARQAASTQHPALSTSAAALVAGLRGISPLAAREVVFRACGDTSGQPDPGALHAALAALLVEVEPTLAGDGDELTAFAPYALTHLAALRLERVASASAAVERYDGASAGTFAGADGVPRASGKRAPNSTPRTRASPASATRCNARSPRPANSNACARPANCC